MLLVVTACSPAPGAPPDVSAAPDLATTSATTAPLPAETPTTSQPDSTPAAPQPPTTTVPPTTLPITPTPSSTAASDAIDVLTPMLVQPQAAPDSVVLTYDGNPGPVTIVISDPEQTEYDVTIVGTASQARPEQWRWTLNGGQRQDTRGNPSEVTYTLTIATNQMEFAHTILGRTKYRGWGEDDIQIVLMRPST